MKKILSILLACCLLAGAVPALAVDAGEARAVIGANLTEEQISAVYSNFGVKRGDVTELRVTNADERKYLEGYVEILLDLVEGRGTQRHETLPTALREGASMRRL